MWLVLGEPWAAIRRQLVLAGDAEMVYRHLLQPFQGSEGGKNGASECERVCTVVHMRSQLCTCARVCVCLCGCRTKHVNRGKEHAVYVRMEAGKGKIT